MVIHPLLAQHNLNLQHRFEQTRHLRRITSHRDAAGLHDVELGFRGISTPRNERTSSTHALSCWGWHAGNETDHGFFHIVFNPIRCVGFVWPTDLTDHDDGIGIGIVIEHLHDVDVL